MIDVSVRISVPRATAWACFTEPKHIVNWNFAGDDWCCPTASNDLRVGGTLNSRMEARDGSFGFDFESTYTAVEPGTHLALSMSDGRTWTVDFADNGEGACIVTERFDPESENSHDLQRMGWQMILDRFAAYAANV